MNPNWNEDPPADLVTADLLLEADALGAPDWLSDEECLHEIGSDWSRRQCANVEGEE